MLKFLLKANLLILVVVVAVGGGIVAMNYYSPNASAESLQVTNYNPTMQDLKAQTATQDKVRSLSDVVKTLNMPDKSAYVDDSSIMSVISDRLGNEKVYQALKNLKLRVGPGDQYAVSQLMAMGQIFVAKTIDKPKNNNPIDVVVNNLTVGTIPSDYGVGWVRLQEGVYTSLEDLSVYADDVDSLYDNNNASAPSKENSVNTVKKASSNEKVSEISDAELLKIVEGYLPDLSKKYDVRFSFDADSICDAKNLDENIRGCVMENDPDTIHLSVAPGSEDSSSLKSLVLHEFSHVVQFNWINEDSTLTAVRDNALYNNFDFEKVADCMAYQLGATTDKPGGYASRNECDVTNPELGAIAAGFLNGTLNIAG